jgi:hypothetical protein
MEEFEVEESVISHSRSKSLWVPFLTLYALLVVIVGWSLISNRLNPVAAQGACANRSIQANIPEKSLIASLSMTSAEDGWAAGWIDDPSGGHGNSIHDASLWDPSIPLLLHFHDCQWAPILVALPHAQLFSISMGSENDGWAVGATIKHVPDTSSGVTMDSLAYDQTILLHYDGFTWQQVHLPGSPTLQRAQVQMISPDEGWLVGDTNAVSNSLPLGNATQLFHFQHGIWNQVDTAPLGPGVPVVKLVANTADDCWLLTWNGADDNETSVITHYHDETWTRQRFPGKFIDDFAMTSSRSGWAMSYEGLLHYDGQTWQPVASPFPSGASRGHGYISSPVGLALPDSQSDDVWVFGVITITTAIANGTSSHSSLSLARYHNGIWQTAPFSLLYEGKQRTDALFGIISLGMVAPNEGWLLLDYPCDNGLPYSHPLFIPSSSLLVHFDGMQWVAYGNLP